MPERRGIILPFLTNTMSNLIYVIVLLQNVKNFAKPKRMNEEKMKQNIYLLNLPTERIWENHDLVHVAYEISVSSVFALRTNHNLLCDVH